MASKTATAIQPTREENYPEWYQQVIKAAELAENSPARGCMIIKPWGYGIWERIQAGLDKRIKETGHENAYFPLFIPLSLLQKEAEHVEGFAKECAVVTHHRLEERNGKLVPTGELEDPFVVRPTSETIIGEAYSQWVQSYRDLPLLINQWANVVRWEMRPRLFLRTAEFLWQEGHTVHATEAEAREEVHKMLEVYREFIEGSLAIPVIAGEKTEDERFPGAVQTLCVEAMMQDGKALQAGTSHYLGQNFAKASTIRFLNKDGQLEYAYTTSWGVSTRLIGGLIMAHSDDDGLRLPPMIAPKHVVILPLLNKEERNQEVLAEAHKLHEALSLVEFMGQRVVSHVDKRDLRGGEKNWQWIKRGIPLRIEIGPRDIESGNAMLYRRDRDRKDKLAVPFERLPEVVADILPVMQENYFAQAAEYKKQRTVDNIKNVDELRAYFTEDPKAGFVQAKWCEDQACTSVLQELKLSIRCIPLQQSEQSGPCIFSGRNSSKDIIIARAY